MVEAHRKKEYPDPAAVQLISHLSEGAYTTFGKAVKELVINAFDADARTVSLDFDSNLSQLTITDDGDGMSEQKFKKEFLRIGGSKRRLEQRARRFKRPVIGRFGIGFLSVARLCDSVTVYSKEKDTEHTIVREIPLKHFFEPDRQLKNLAQEYCYYSLADMTKQPRGESYTKIVLNGLRPDILEDLRGKPTSKDAWRTVDQLSGIERFKWELGVFLPVRYRSQFPVFKRSEQVLRQIRAELEDFEFDVLVNGEKILKPICLGRHFFKDAVWNYQPNKIVPLKEGEVFAVESPAGASVKFCGYLYNQSKQIQPVSLRGVLLRVNHIGIKGFSKSLYEYPKNIGPIQAAISGEIFLGADFEDVLTLDKDDFKEDHPKFKELVSYIHNTVDSIATASRSRSRTVKSKKKRKVLPKIRDLDLSSKEIKTAEKIVGRKNFKKEYFPNVNLTVRTNIKNLRTTVRSLLGKTLDVDEGDYLLESLTCFKASCWRGAILMAWNTGLSRIHRKITTDVGFERIQSQINSMKQTAPKHIKDQLSRCGSQEELEHFNERALFLVLKGLGLMDSSTADLFNQPLGVIRNKSAHPTGHKPSDGEAIFMIQAVLKYILNEATFKVS